MKEEKGVIYTEPKIEVKVPLRFCSDCAHYLQTASKEPCESCLKNTKGDQWKPQ